MADNTSKARRSISPESANPDDSADIATDDSDVESAANEIIGEKEIGGRDGPDPTRYGDWEKNGRCIDF